MCGDVKPSNVVRFSGGLQRWKLIDLGGRGRVGAMRDGVLVVLLLARACKVLLAWVDGEGIEMF